MSAKRGAEPRSTLPRRRALWTTLLGPDRDYRDEGATGKARINRKARDESTASRLWEVSEELTGVRFLS